MRKSIGYSTRAYEDNSKKLTGGVFGGSIDLETANRLVKHHFTVEVLQSGTPVFVDKQGRRVYLYMSIHPELTEVGAAAVKEWRRKRADELEAQEELEARQREEIQELTDALSHSEAVRRLRGG